MDPREEFCSRLALLTGHAPFPWQQRLYDEFLAQRVPQACDIPTALGKSSVIPIWLLALAGHASAGTGADFPRRLAYIVNSNTVVDQATFEAERIRHALATKRELRDLADVLRSLGTGVSGDPVAISTIRGRFADDADWRHDPARAAIIVGTVDDVGSRLLFAGYGCGFESKPLDAGLLGQDALLVHDEARLEPAFQQLIAAVAAEQQRCGELGRLWLMALNATSCSGNDALRLTEADRSQDQVRQRLAARKGIVFHPVDDEDGVADRVVTLALAYRGSGQAILVFLRRLEDVEEVATRLGKAPLPTQKLTGTLRGLERDALVKDDPILARFLPIPGVVPTPGVVFLVCTCAGEVGTDISGDHLVCDVTPFDRMVRRVGRVNRFGDGDARIDIVHPRAYDQKDALRDVRQRTVALLRTLPKAHNRHDASTNALLGLPAPDRQAACTTPPGVVAVTDILFDAWALTSIRGKLPGRPPVADWLRGVAEWRPRETSVAWREDVAVMTPALQERYTPEDLLGDFPLRPHERLRDHTWRVFRHLEKIARRHPELSAWVWAPDGGVTVHSLAALVERDSLNNPVANLADCTVLLPPEAGGLAKGTLDGDAEFERHQRALYDVADAWMYDRHPRRCRVWNDGPPPAGMRLLRTIDTRPDRYDEADERERPDARRCWRWYVRPRWANHDGTRVVSRTERLDPHGRSAEECARLLVAKLGLDGREASAVTLAARWHDLGKDRAIWQRSIGNRDYPHQALAMSGGTMPSVVLTGYRHEFGSLIDVSRLPEFFTLDPDVRDLLLHVIAAHHGRGRPHFSVDEAFDFDGAEGIAAGIARDTPRRFGRLQRKYGRWGLAYLESLARAADALASQGEDSADPEISSRPATLPYAVTR